MSINGIVVLFNGYLVVFHLYLRSRKLTTYDFIQDRKKIKHNRKRIVPMTFESLESLPKSTKIKDEDREFRTKTENGEELESNRPFIIRKYPRY